MYYSAQRLINGKIKQGFLVKQESHKEKNILKRISYPALLNWIPFQKVCGINLWSVIYRDAFYWNTKEIPNFSLELKERCLFHCVTLSTEMGSLSLLLSLSSHWDGISFSHIYIYLPLIVCNYIICDSPLLFRAVTLTLIKYFIRTWHFKIEKLCCFPPGHLHPP